MMFGQSVKMAWSSVISNKMRSFLTMLGIIIGVIALVVLVSIANGATGQVTDIISSIGSNLLTVTVTDDKGNPIRLREMEEIGAIDGVSEAAPIATENLTVSADGEEETASVTGTTAAYFQIEGKELSAGRSLKTADVENHTNVIVINQKTASDLLGVSDTADAPGKKLTLNGLPYTVVGVLAEQETVSVNLSDYECYIPYTSLMRLSSGVSDISQFAVSAVDDGELDQVEVNLKVWLHRRLGNDDDAYSVFNMSTIVDTLDQVMGTMSIMLGGIAAISLLVGGIGIMNIMLVSVTERTREIGIRKAIGAGRGSILTQFLIEALMLSVFGDALGVAASWGLLRLIAVISGYSFAMDRSVVIAASVFSLLIGLIFGIYPARKAASMNPIDALHYN